jgi:transposase-like protein
LRQINARASRHCHGAAMTETTNKQTGPNCPSCGKPLVLMRTIPGIGGLPELCVYSCRQCGVSLTEASDGPAEPASCRYPLRSRGDRRG